MEWHGYCTKQVVIKNSRLHYLTVSLKFTPDPCCYGNQVAVLNRKLAVLGYVKKYGIKSCTKRLFRVTTCRKH